MVKKRKRWWALFMSAALIVTQLPSMTARAHQLPKDGSIISFEALDSDIKKQIVPLDTEQSELNLPNMVTVTICHITEDMEIPDEDEPLASPDEASINDTDHDTKKTITSFTTSEEEIPVTWDSKPAYDAATAGSYIFTADVGSYILSDGVKLPIITVQVGETGAALPPPNNIQEEIILDWTFADDDMLYEGQISLPGVSKEQQASFDDVAKLLPTQINAELEGEETTKLLDIIGWLCPDYKQDDENNWPLSGTYTFTAQLPSGYSCDPLPTVEVVIGGASMFATNNSVTMHGITITASNGGSVEYSDDSGFTLNANGDYTITGDWEGGLNGSAASPTAVITVQDSEANIDLSDVTINVSDSDYVCAFMVSSGSNANITLSGTNTLTSGASRAGLEVPDGAEVTIDGDDSAELTASGGSGIYNSCIGGGAGIGGAGGIDGTGGDAGIIKITAGTIAAYGGAGSDGDNSGSYNGAGGGSGFGGGGGSGGSFSNFSGGNGGNIEISNSTITNARGGAGGRSSFSGGGGAGFGGGGAGASLIGGGGGGAGGDIKISNSIIADTSGGIGFNNRGGIGVGGGGSGGSGHGTSGNISIADNAVVYVKDNNGAPHIGGSDGEVNVTIDNSVVFKGTSGEVYGESTLPGNITIPSDTTLTVPQDTTLTIPKNITITTTGNPIINNGIINLYGKINPYLVVDNGRINNASNTKVTFAVKENGNYGNNTTSASWGDTIRITATATQMPEQITARSAETNMVDFYIKYMDSNHLIGSSDVISDESTAIATATLEIPLSDDTWDTGFEPGPNTIYADFGGSGTLFGSTGNATLTISEVKIQSASVEITEPVPDEIPADDTAIPTNAYYTVSDITWSGELNNGKFNYATEYKVSITLKAKDFCQFANNITCTLNGKEALTTINADDSLTLTYTFSETVGESRIPVTGVTLDNNSLTLNKGQIVTLTAAIQPVNATNKSMSWSTSNATVATVDENGTVTAHTAGTAVITVTTEDGLRTAECTITVTPNTLPHIPVTGVTLDNNSLTLNKGQIVTLTAAIQPVNATNKSMSWSTSNATVATVDENGTVTAHTAGTAVITVTTEDGLKTAECTITVTSGTTFSNRSSGRSGGSNYVDPSLLRGHWLQTEAGIWMFRRTDGSYAKNCWGITDGLWYRFNTEGQMLTGWQHINNQWYYLNTAERATTQTGTKEGSMMIGWHYDPAYQSWFYHDTSGAMVTGWREIDSKWYYFNPISDGTKGTLQTNRQIDGWQLDQAGVGTPL